jgi:iron complex outermembrane receptor protein
MKTIKTNRQFMPSFKLGYVALAITALSAHQAVMAQGIETVEVTGSLIKRAMKEALPLTIVKAEEFTERGLTSLADVMLALPQSISLAPSPSAGSGTNMNLRGLGTQRTLILLDGKRLANESTSTSAFNLNLIPFSALERVEVLTDGASSIYGSDAMGGVVNFITKKVYQGTEIKVTGNNPTRSGGGQDARASLTFGKGDLAQDGWNWYATADMRHQQRLALQDRPEVISADAYSSVGLVKKDNSSSTFPANASYKVGTTSYVYNPGCVAPYSAPSVVGATAYPCYTGSAADTAIADRIDKTLYTKGTLKLEGHTVTLDYMRGESQFINIKAPATATQPAAQKDYIPALTAVSAATINTNPFYAGLKANILSKMAPGSTAVTTTATLAYGIPIDYSNIVDTQTDQRISLTDRGTFGDWDYKASLIRGWADRKSVAGQGNVNGNLLNTAINNGTFNPFAGDMTQLSPYLIAPGTPVRTSSTTHNEAAIVVNRELPSVDVGAGPAGLALGASAAQELFIDQKHAESQANIPFGAAPVTSWGGLGGYGRNIRSVFGEIELPVTKKFTINSALRYDSISDVSASSVTPKISFKYTESKDLMFRGGASRGFRAPSLAEIGGYMGAPNTPTTDTGSTKYADPATCNMVTLKLLANPAVACPTSVLAVRAGANRDLISETSQTITYGVVGSPVENSLLSMDVWRISMNHQLAQLAVANIMTNPGLYQFIKRNADGTINYVDTSYQNLDGSRMSGIDLHAEYAFRVQDLGTFTPIYDATILDRFDTRLTSTDPWTSGLGQFGILSNAPFASLPSMGFRVRSTARINWQYGNWNSTLSNTFSSSFTDLNPAANRIHPYSIFNLSVAYRGIKDADVIVGVNNIGDRMPPKTNMTGYVGPFVSSLGSVLGRSIVATFAYRF